MNNLQPILLVDDNSIDVMTVKRCFEELGINNKLIVAENGRTALDLLTQSENRLIPCMILLDISMPIMNGFEFLSKIRCSTELKRLPVIILSASKEKEDVIASYELGVSGYLVKQVDYKDFVKSISLLANYWSINELPL